MTIYFFIIGLFLLMAPEQAPYQIPQMLAGLSIMTVSAWGWIRRVR